MIKFLVFIALFCAQINAIELLKLGNYKGEDISGWLASEKLDGVRAYWDGKRLLSRQGKPIAAPKELLNELPSFALDGELYSGRGGFERTQSIVMDAVPDIKAWQNISYEIFDAPGQKGNLLERLKVVKKYINSHDTKFLKLIKQRKISNKIELDNMLNEIIKAGGEGVVIRDPSKPYTPKRSQHDLKYKKFDDAECMVVAINKGKGKLKGVMGSLTCEKNGVRFKIGSGFNDNTRKNPPKIGEIITFKHLGFTAKGIPRHAVFLRIRRD